MRVISILHIKDRDQVVCFDEVPKGLMVGHFLIDGLNSWVITGIEIPHYIDYTKKNPPPALLLKGDRILQLDDELEWAHIDDELDIEG